MYKKHDVTQESTDGLITSMPDNKTKSKSSQNHWEYLQVEPQTTFPQFRITGSSRRRPQPGMSHKKSSTRQTAAGSPPEVGSSADASPASSLLPSDICAPRLIMHTPPACIEIHLFLQEGVTYIHVHIHTYNYAGGQQYIRFCRRVSQSTNICAGMHRSCRGQNYRSRAFPSFVYSTAQHFPQLPISKRGFFLIC